MSKRNHEAQNENTVNAKKSKLLPFSTSSFLKSKMFIGDKSA